MIKKTWILGLVVAVAGVCALSTTSMGQEEKKAAAINSVCPVGGNDAVADKTSTVTVKFCCANCKGKFEKDPVAVLAKLEKLPNEKCPLAGKPVGDAEASVTVAFCCGNCKGKFDSDSSKYLSKIKAAAKK